MKVCVAEINGADRLHGIYIMLKEMEHLHPYFFPSG